MKNLVLLFLLAVVVSACTQKAAPVESSTNEAIESNKTLNVEVTAKDGSKKLLGPVNYAGLNQPPYSSWLSNGAKYKADAEVISSLSNSLKGYSIKAFFGTWCGDSKEHMPDFYAVMEKTDFDMNDLEVIAVDNEQSMYKKSPSGEGEGLNIHRVPTFIFYKKGKEMGRIVESPKETLEKDMLKITTGEEYKENYYVVSILDKLVQSKGMDYVAKHQADLVADYSGKTKSMYELNTYSRTYLYAGKRTEGKSVLYLNQALYPDEEYTMNKLATALIEDKQYAEAISVLDKFMAAHSDNKTAQALMKRVNSLVEND